MNRSPGSRPRDEEGGSNAASSSFEETWQFVLKVGEAAVRYGSSAPRLQSYLEALSRHFGHEGVFGVTARAIVFALREAPGRLQRIELMRAPPAGTDLNRLARLGDLLDDVTADRVSLSAASIRMEAIDRIEAPWGVGWNLFAYCLIGFSLAPLLGGGWPDAWVAMVLSGIVYSIVLLSERLGDPFADWIPLTTAFVAGALAAIAKLWIPELNLVLVVLSAIAVLLPGYAISTGVIELAAQHILSGAERLMGGLVGITTQFLGAWLGVMLVSHLVSLPTAASAPSVDGMWMWLIVPMTAVGLCIVFQTSTRDFLWAFLACVTAYLGIYAGSVFVGGNFGNLLGTIIAVAFANLWAGWKNRPTSIVLIPALVLLVSGSIGFRGLASIAEGQLALGSVELLQMFLVALTIAAGLLIGNTLFRPRITL